MGFGNGLLEMPVKLVTLREVVMKIHAICAACPELAVVICAGRKGDMENLRIISNNLSYEQKREMVARVHNSLATGTIQSE
jgi:thymidine kinase